MARNNNKMTKRQKMPKIEPAVTTMAFTWTVPAGTQLTKYIDLSQCASLLNRRFYRQGLNWAVSGFKANVFGPANTNSGQIDMLKLPETWVMSNLWHKGFAAWEKMNDDALEENESIRPRFLDFKIYADTKHHIDGFIGNLLPINAAALAVAGEWESSKFIVPESGVAGATHTREVLATGANYPGASPVTTFNAISLIEGYAASRGLPEIRDPNAPDDAADADGLFPENWITALSNEGLTQDSEVITDMITENNQAPYPFENAQVPGAAPGVVFTDTNYPGGANQLTGLQISDSSFITTTTVGGHTRLKGGLFPCGLIRIDTTNANPVDPGNPFTVALLVDMVPGTHRGYLCEPMQDM